ncbi:hypothetical protein OSB04_006111 [Centaurea solstitialis]|uniref:DUF4283 domain-containing protein n=1 Tax=Centaurea solstitialis TaxID=347529 RepID=A0AA38TSV3_9ASTR|nr:hypothetical protein OSB04_006111 [Centaurea solstitialis]
MSCVALWTSVPRKNENLESLDLSQNSLSGEISQQSLLQQDSLLFCMCHSTIMKGAYPRKEGKSYTGILRLCGKPLSKECENLKVSTTPQASNKSESFFPSERVDRSMIFSGVGSRLVIEIRFGMRNRNGGKFKCEPLFGCEREDNRETLDKIVAEKTNGLHYWIKDLSKLTPGFRNSERLAWLKVEGLPLQIWKQETFKVIASRWGKVLELHNCELEDSDSAMWGKILIGTCLKERISVISSVKVGNLYYVIRIEEDDGALQDTHSMEEESFSQSMEEDDASDEGLNSSSDWSAEESGSEDDWLVEESIFEGNKEKPSMKSNSKESSGNDAEAKLADAAAEESGDKPTTAIGDFPVDDRKEGESAVESGVKSPAAIGKQSLPVEDQKEGEELKSGEYVGASNEGGNHTEALDHMGKMRKPTANQVLDEGVGPVRQANKPSNFVGPLDKSVIGLVDSYETGLPSVNKDGPNLENVSQIKLQLQGLSNQLQDRPQIKTTRPEKGQLKQFSMVERKGMSSEELANQDVNGAKLRSCRSEFNIFGRGRMSFHLLKQKARIAQKKRKKPGNSLTRPKSNSGGNNSSSESINPPLANEVEVEHGVPNEELERFGEAIGVIWNKEKTGDAQPEASS